jgi:hypothetical protein
MTFSLTERPWSQSARYLIVTLLVAANVGLRALPPLQELSVFLFVPAIFLGASLFGRGPAIFASALALLIALFFWIEPVHSFHFTARDIPPLALYLLICLAIIASCEWARTALQGQATEAAPAASEGLAGKAGRFAGLDFWRGFVLCTIFVTHVPGNIFENYTFRSLGFSDSAEAFVCLSGISLALAYGRRFAAGERLRVCIALGRRALKLYGVHIALSLAALAIFSAGAMHWNLPWLEDEHGRDLFVAHARLCIEAILGLGHQLGYFNILPLYLALILWVPLFLWLAGIDRSLMLGLSVLLYAAARLFNWNLPSWPLPGGWFFNPFTWQLVMAIGIIVGLYLREHGRLPLSRVLTVLSTVVVLFALLVVMNGFSGLLGPWGELRPSLDLDKTNTGTMRLLHFLALAYLVHISGITSWLQRTPIFSPLAMLGRHSLMIFALLSILAAIGQVLMAAEPHSTWFDIALIGGGILVLYFAARLCEAATARHKAVGSKAVVRA